MHILAISGSFRKGSFNTSLARAFIAAAPEDVTIELLDYQSLPLFNQDVETSSFPKEAADLKEKIRAADGILIATPEYNRSIPGVLKNLIDWTSRPYGDSAWDGKPVYVISASGGNLAAALSQYDVKKVMLYLNTHILGQPEFFLGGADKKFDEEGALTDNTTREHIDKALAAFIVHVKSFNVPSSRSLP